MFTLTLVDLEYETSAALTSFHLATLLNSQNTNETEFINDL